MEKRLRFKAAFDWLALPFVAITAAVYVYVWVRYPTFTAFMNHAFPYQVPVIAVHCGLAYLVATAKPPRQESGQAEDDECGSEDDEFWINPNTGATMIGGIGGIDTMGYGFGSGPDDD
jgi:hypothetical protein